MSRRAFTLIELLIVVSIISILASIATPNFLEAQTRAKVSRAKNDMRVVATALESYAVDNNHYPPRRMSLNVLGWEWNIGQVETKAADLKTLTTPIAYISSLPIDIFDRFIAPPNNIIDYWPAEFNANYITPPPTSPLLGGFPAPPPLPLAATKDPGYALLAVGPDGHLGYAGSGFSGCPPVPINSPFGNSLRKTYDPTNGTVSYGNVFRFQGGMEPGSVFYSQ